jgi:hypothetical protein
MSSLALVEELNPAHEAVQLSEAAPGAMQLLLDLEATGALTIRALSLPAEVSYAEYEGLGAFLGEFKSRINFYLGDWLIFGEGTFAERWSQACEGTGLAEQTLLRVMAVCRGIPPSRRVDQLSWSVHAAVYTLPAREQKTWLRRALEHGWGYAELRKAMQSARRDERPPMFDDHAAAGEVDQNLLVEAARSLIRNAEEAGENVIVRVEDYTRVKAALGEE